MLQWDVILHHMIFGIWSSDSVRLVVQLEQVIVCPGGLRNQLDGRQLKICSTCFDIAVGLLRVIEMIVCVYPQVFVAGVTQHSELLLHRLLQVNDLFVFEKEHST